MPSQQAVSDTYGDYINALRENFRKQADVLRALVAESAAALAQLELDVAGLDTTVASHTTSIGALNTTVASHTTSIDTLNTTVAGHTTSIGSLNTTVAGHTTAITTIQNTYMPKSGGTFTGQIAVTQIDAAVPEEGIRMSNRLFVRNTRPVCSGGYSMIENGRPITDTTDELSIDGAGAGSLIIQPGAFTLASSSRAVLSGIISTDGPQTITFRVYAGKSASVFVTAFPITLDSTNKSTPWRLETILTCKGVGPAEDGTGGRLQVDSFFVLNDTENARTFVDSPLAFIDTTTTNHFGVTAQWDIASGGNTLETTTFNTFNTFFT